MCGVWSLEQRAILLGNLWRQPLLLRTADDDLRFL
jgi:hypothetical protein